MTSSRQNFLLFLEEESTTSDAGLTRRLNAASVLITWWKRVFKILKLRNKFYHSLLGIRTILTKLLELENCENFDEAQNILKDDLFTTSLISYLQLLPKDPLLPEPLRKSAKNPKIICAAFLIWHFEGDLLSSKTDKDAPLSDEADTCLTAAGLFKFAFIKLLNHLINSMQPHFKYIALRNSFIGYRATTRHFLETFEKWRLADREELIQTLEDNFEECAMLEQSAILHIEALIDYKKKYVTDRDTTEIEFGYNENYMNEMLEYSRNKKIEIRNTLIRIYGDDTEALSRLDCMESEAVETVTNEFVPLTERKIPPADSNAVSTVPLHFIPPTNSSTTPSTTAPIIPLVESSSESSTSSSSTSSTKPVTTHFPKPLIRRPLTSLPTIVSSPLEPYQRPPRHQIQQQQQQLMNPQPAKNPIDTKEFRMLCTMLSETQIKMFKKLLTLLPIEITYLVNEVLMEPSYCLLPSTFAQDLTNVSDPLKYIDDYISNSTGVEPTRHLRPPLDQQSLMLMLATSPALASDAIRMQMLNSMADRLRCGLMKSPISSVSEVQ